MAAPKEEIKKTEKEKEEEDDSPKEDKDRPHADPAKYYEVGSDNERLRLIPNGEVVVCAKIKKSYKILSKLGEGGYGAVYKVEEVETKNLYAMKVESRVEEQPVLKMEVEVLKMLAKLKAKNACAILAIGSYDVKFHYVVMTLCGPALSDTFRKRPGGRFRMSTALRVGAQTLQSIEDLHRTGHIHRDLKPHNFAIGRPDSGEWKKVFILDFGCCRKFRKENGDLRYPRNAVHFHGTYEYAPLTAHRNREQARKDDLESWMYMIIEMHTGNLPWIGKSYTKDQIRNMKELARSDPGLGVMLDPSTRTRGDGKSKSVKSKGAKEDKDDKESELKGDGTAPEEYKAIIAYVDSLEYWDPPDYTFIRRLLSRVYSIKFNKTLDEALNDPYDWELDAEKKNKDEKVMPQKV